MLYHIRQKVMSLHGVYNVTDTADRLCFHVKQRAVSATNHTVLYDENDLELGTIHRKMVSLHGTHTIEMSNGEKAELREHRALELHDNYDVEGFGWTVAGNITGHEFAIQDAGGNEIARSQEAYLSIGDRMAVEVLDESQTAKVVAVLIAILEIQRDRKNAVAHDPQ